MLQEEMENQHCKSIQWHHPFATECGARRTSSRGSPTTWMKVMTGMTTVLGEWAVGWARRPNFGAQVPGLIGRVHVALFAARAG